MIILPEKAWQFEIKLPEKVRQFEIRLPEARQRMIILPENVSEEFTVDPSIEAILEAAERIDEEVKGPRFESSPQ